MKKLFAKPAFLAVLFVVVYLFGLILGVCAVGAYPIYFKQKEFFQREARTIAQEYLTGAEDALKRMTGANTRILIYDAAGNCLRHVAPSNEMPDAAPGAAPAKYIPSLLAGKEVYRPVLADETHRQFHDIMVVTGVPIRDGGAVVGAVLLIRNLIDLPAMIAGYSVFFTLFYWLSACVFLSSARRKRKLDKLQQNYIANVTHAFKTPIASIKALAETLCDGVEPDPDRQRVYYGMILQEANRQDHMVRDVLELSKLQSNGMDFTKEKIYADALFEPVWEKYATLCDCMGISLHISEEIACLPPLYTNASCVKQILEILLDNAVKFVSEGGDIWVDASAARNQATISVRDNGIGITKDALPHVFERFYKYSHDFNESGSGLGLAIAKEISVGLKEKIWVESEPGKGAVFFFTVHYK